MLMKKVIEEVSSIKWQSRLFIVPKKEQGKHRIILDLSRLNKMIACPSFKMLSLREVRRNLPQGAFTCSIDLKDGYWHVPITPKLRPFLGFRYNQRLFQYRAMPFGLNVAPRTFTKVMFKVMKIVAGAGIWVLPYLDDFLVVSHSRSQNLRDTQSTLNVLKEMGFLINPKKSRLIPARRFLWLGITWDLGPSRSCSIPKETWSKFMDLLRSVCLLRPTKKQIMCIQGLANWMASVDPCLKLFMALTRRILRAAAQLSKNSAIRLSWLMRAKLFQWMKYTPISTPLGAPDPEFTIMTDASLRGWGIVLGEMRFSGYFHPSMNYSINVKELLVVWMALLLIDTEGVPIRILVDNTQAIFTVRKGYARTFHLRSLGDLILKRLRDKRQTLEIKHIQGSFNVLSDQLSRNTTISTEWSLPQATFNKEILRRFPALKWDMFATSLNKKLPKFVSPCPDTGATAIDALTMDWAHLEGLYLFPPTPLISKVVEKWLASKPKTSILITGYWPARPWFARLLQINKTYVRISVRLQQVVGDKTVVQSSPTELLVWKL